MLETAFRRQSPAFFTFFFASQTLFHPRTTRRCRETVRPARSAHRYPTHKSFPGQEVVGANDPERCGQRTVSLFERDVVAKDANRIPFVQRVPETDALERRALGPRDRADPIFMAGSPR